MHIRIMANIKLSLRMSDCGWLFVSVMTLRLVQGVTLPSPQDS